MTRGKRAEILARKLLSSLPLFVLILLVWMRSAAAAETRAIVLTGGDGALASLAEHVVPALQGQLQELNVQVLERQGRHEAVRASAQAASQLAGSGSALGVVWLERKASVVVVYLYDAGGHHLYAREVDGTGSLTSIAEEIAIVLRSAIGAMLEGSAIGMTAVPIPETKPAQAPTPAQPSHPPRAEDERGPQLRLGGSYVGTVFARATSFQHGARASASLSFPASSLFAGLGYTYFPASSLLGSGVRAELKRHPAEMVFGAELRVGAVYVTAEGAVIADRLLRKTWSEADGVTATAPSARWLWALSTRLGCAIGLTTRVRLQANVGAEFLLNPFDQVIADTAGQTVALSSPLLARPRFELGFLVAP